jgi:hypothetical protein
VSGGPVEWTVICNGDMESLIATLRRMRGEVVEDSPATFEEIFHARVTQPEPDPL